MSETASPALSRGSRWRRVRLFLLFGLLAGLLLHVTLDFMAGRRLAASLARLEQRVGSLSAQRLSPEPVPADENLARLVRAASALAVPPAQAITNAINALGSGPDAPTVPDEVRAYVAANQAAIALSAEFGLREKSNWEIDYRAGANRPTLIEIRALGDLLRVSALLELEAGRVHEAARHVANGLAVSASLRQEPDLITQLIRVAVANRQIDGVQRLVTQPGLSRAALELVAARLAGNRTPSPMTTGMIGELTLINSRFAAAEAGQADERNPGARVFGASRVLSRIGRPILRFQWDAYLHRMEAILESQLGPRPRLAVPPEHESFLARQFMPGITVGLTRALVTGDDHDSELAAAETVVALRRYQLERGEYPADLSALAPLYLQTLPIDPFTGQPPAYAREGTGFRLTTRRSDERLMSRRPTAEWVIR